MFTGYQQTARHDTFGHRQVLAHRVPRLLRLL